MASSHFYICFFLLFTFSCRGAARISALQCVLAHSQCRGDCPLELIQALVDSDPRMANQKHLYTGSVPLHAVFYNAFFTSSKRTAIAKILLAASPQSVAVRNNDGRTALHTNASQHCNYEPTLLLLKAAPEITRWTDHNWDLPLHCACRSHKSPSKVEKFHFDCAETRHERLILSHSHSLLFFPFFLRVRSYLLSIQSIIAIFKHFPAAIIAVNSKGRTPVDDARLSALADDKKESRLQVLRTLQSEYEHERRSSCCQKRKKRRVDQKPRNAKVDEDQSIVADERDDTDAMHRCEDGARMPSLGEVVRVSNDVSGREKIESTSVDTNDDDLDVISPSLLLAMMKNHTVL